jgi:sugar/nucleoside kinase (ribokinase family)
MNDPSQRSYLAVGHVTVDVLESGERRAGGTALYSALQAARLGLASHIHTRGREEEIHELLAPFAAELDVTVEPAPATTTLQTSGSGAARRQHAIAWAGPIRADSLAPASILHLAPVAAELEALPPGDWGFVGLTPQGLARGWETTGAEVLPREPAAGALALFDRSDAVVLSREERAWCEQGIQRARRRDALVAVTAGRSETLLLAPGGEELALETAPVVQEADDLGAGDVYAATLFVALSEGAAPRAAALLAGAAAALRLKGRGAAAIAGREAVEAQAASAASSSSPMRPGSI